MTIQPVNEIERFWVRRLEEDEQNSEMGWATLEDEHGGERFKVLFNKDQLGDVRLGACVVLGLLVP